MSPHGNEPIAAHDGAGPDIIDVQKLRDYAGFVLNSFFGIAP